MKDQILIQWFESFRRQGDLEALGSLFDATAPELARVASAWSRHTADVEDLLQATFVTAIERAEHHDGQRSPLPWLLGILVMHAHEARRKSARRVEPDRLPERSVAEPETKLEASELALQIERALESLRAQDRQVLDPFLQEGKSARDIAAERGQRPGTVRMQIHRALARLRAALPTGVALGGAAVSMGDESWAALRSRVLEQGAGLRAGQLEAGSGSAGGHIETLLSMKTALVSLSLVAALSIAWFALPGQSAQADGEGWARDVQEGRELARKPSNAKAPSTPSKMRREVWSDAQLALDRELQASFGMRLVDGQGKPLAGIEVHVLEPSLEQSSTSPEQSWGVHSPAPNLFFTKTTSDAEGRIHVRGMNPSAKYFLGLDYGGPLARNCYLPLQLKPGQELDAGDLVVGTAAMLRGRLQDAEGRPIPGARLQIWAGENVSIDPKGAEIQALQAAGFSATLDAHGGLSAISELYYDHIQRVSMPNTRSDENGAFLLPFPALGPQDQLTLLVDALGYEACQRSLAAYTGKIDVELKALTLLEGKQVELTIVDATGSAQAGLQVFAGVYDQERNRHGMRPVGYSDEHGQLMLANLPSRGKLLLAVDHAAGKGRSVALVEEQQERVHIELRRGAALNINLIDEAGAPVQGAELWLGRYASAPYLWPAPAPIALNDGAQDWQEPLPGHYRLEGVASQNYFVVARAAGRMTCLKSFVMGAEPMQLKLPLLAPKELRIEVRDALGDPIQGVRLTHASSGARGGIKVGMSDALGHCKLNVPANGSDELLFIDHPQYAKQRLNLDPTASQQSIVLRQGGSIQIDGPVAWNDQPWVIVLRDERFVERWGNSENGRIQMNRVSPGTHKYSVFAGSQLGRSLNLSWGDAIQTGRVKVEESCVAQLELHFEPNARAVQRASVHGKVIADGLPVSHALVRVRRVGTNHTATVVDVQAGTYAIDELDAGEYTLTVLAPVASSEQPQALAQTNVELLSGEGRQQDFAWSTHRLRLTLWSEGRPLPGALVRIQELEPLPLEKGAFSRPKSYLLWTDQDGLLEADLVGTGTYTLQIHDEELGLARALIDLDRPGDLAPMDLRLDRGVPFAGVIRLVGIGASDPWNKQLVLHDSAGFEITRIKLRFESDLAPFRYVGLPSGSYSASLIKGNGAPGPALTLTLPAEGSNNLILDMQGVPPPSRPSGLAGLGYTGD